MFPVVRVNDVPLFKVKKTQRLRSQDEYFKKMTHVSHNRDCGWWGGGLIHFQRLRRSATGRMAACVVDTRRLHFILFWSTFLALNSTQCMFLPIFPAPIKLDGMSSVGGLMVVGNVIFGPLSVHTGGSLRRKCTMLKSE